MKTKKVKVVYEATGENQGTYDILGSYDDLCTGIDLDEKVSRFVSWDCNIPIEVDRYKVYEVELPEWLSVESWHRGKTDWKWLWGFGVDKSWKAEWQYKLNSLRKQNGNTALLGVTKLLNSKPRKEERKTFRRKIVRWLNSEKFYTFPVELYKLTNQYLVDEAKQIDNRLYWNR